MTAFATSDAEQRARRVNQSEQPIYRCLDCGEVIRQLKRHAFSIGSDIRRTFAKTCFSGYSSYEFKSATTMIKVSTRLVI
jgi:hypothetical protein